MAAAIAALGNALASGDLGKSLGSANFKNVAPKNLSKKVPVFKRIGRKLRPVARVFRSVGKLFGIGSYSRESGNVAPNKALRLDRRLGYTGVGMYGQSWKAGQPSHPHRAGRQPYDESFPDQHRGNKAARTVSRYYSEKRPPSFRPGNFDSSVMNKKRNTSGSVPLPHAPPMFTERALESRVASSVVNDLARAVPVRQAYMPDAAAMRAAAQVEAMAQQDARMDTGAPIAAVARVLSSSDARTKAQVNANARLKTRAAVLLKNAAKPIYRKYLPPVKGALDWRTGSTHTRTHTHNALDGYYPLKRYYPVKSFSAQSKFKGFKARPNVFYRNYAGGR